MHQSLDEFYAPVHVTDVLGSDIIDAQTLNLRTTTWAPNTSSTYDTTIQR
jgi:hypothetical protein